MENLDILESYNELPAAGILHYSTLFYIILHDVESINHYSLRAAASHVSVGHPLPKGLVRSASNTFNSFMNLNNPFCWRWEPLNVNRPDVGVQDCIQRLLYR